MAAALKKQFGVDIPGKIAAMISLAAPDFAKNSFLRDALQGYEALGLLARGTKIAVALRRHLPQPFEEAVEIFVKTLGPPLEETENLGMSPFLYLPHVCFVAEFGLEDFEASMQVQYELTQRFSAEFSIRPFLERHTDATLARLRTWATDASPHVRQLVSDGTRPVLELLDILKDDPELYVRKSVANNLNDIGKANVSLRDVSIDPRRPAIGKSVTVAFEIRNKMPKSQQVVADLRVHFVKANCKTSPKVFKLNAAKIAPGETIALWKTISLAQLTTRKHYSGVHRVDVVLNGAAKFLGHCELLR